MSFYEKLEKFSPQSFYNPTSKLAHHVYERSVEAFRRADRRRARVKTQDDFYAYREANIKSILKSLGDIPYDKSLPLSAKITGSFTYLDMTIERVVFESRPGVFVTGNFYLPNNREGRIPAVLFQAGHSPLGRACEPYSRVCTTIASNGIAVFSIDPIGQGERYSFDEASPVKEHQYFGNRLWLNGESLTKYFVADAMRALDYLETRPEIDPSRIGSTGSSGGGTMTALLSAIDDRIKAAAPGTFITDRETYLYADSAQDAEQIWYGATSSLFDHVELVSCMCPKPYMILVVDSDFFCIEGSERTYETVKRFYDIFGAGDRLEMTVDASTHAYTAPLAAAAAKFFVKALLGEERETSPVEPPELSLLKVLESDNVFSLPGAITAEQENLAGYEKAKPLSRSEAKRRLEKAVFAGRTMSEPRVRHFYQMSSDEYDADMILWFSQAHMPCYGVLIKNKDEKDGNHPITVCLWKDGTDAISSHAEDIDRILASGRAVLIPDLVGIGKCAPDKISAAKGSFAYDARIKHNADLMFLGDSIGAMVAFDLLATVNMLKKAYGAEVSVYADGTFSIYADVLDRLGYGISTEYSNPISAEELMRSSEPDTSAFMDVMFYGVAKFLK